MDAYGSVVMLSLYYTIDRPCANNATLHQYVRQPSLTKSLANGGTERAYGVKCAKPRNNALKPLLVFPYNLQSFRIYCLVKDNNCVVLVQLIRHLKRLFKDSVNCA